MAENQEYEQFDFRPIPDPTVLTTNAVNAATEQWRRELASVQKVIEARLDAADKATVLRLNTMDHIPHEISTQITHQREIHEHDISQINMRFDERDVRTQMAAESSQKALDAALLAAAALVAQQNEANNRAAEKVELSTAKQIEAIQILINTGLDGIDNKVTDLKERLAAYDGTAVGSQDQSTEIRAVSADSRAKVAQFIAAASVVLTVISIIVVIIISKP